MGPPPLPGPTPGPKLPREIIEKTAANYLEALTRLTGIQAG